MKTTKFLQAIAIAGATSVGLLTGSTAIAQEDARTLIADNHTDSAGSMDSSMTIAEVASGSEKFNTLVQAAQAAGLVDTLSQAGPYTVFAPTDEAFSELPDGAVEFLLQPENESLLQQVLTYHIISGEEVTASEISDGSYNTISGGIATRVTDDGRVIVNNASVVQPNIQASNGVIHGINRVLLPRELRNALTTQLSQQQ
jgi:uncharacterized surface protein with fasciclin (FAS1) repeats